MIDSFYSLNEEEDCGRPLSAEMSLGEIGRSQLENCRFTLCRSPPSQQEPGPAMHVDSDPDEVSPSPRALPLHPPHLRARYFRMPQRGSVVVYVRPLVIAVRHALGHLKYSRRPETLGWRQRAHQVSEASSPLLQGKALTGTTLQTPGDLMRRFP